MAEFHMAPGRLALSLAFGLLIQSCGVAADAPAGAAPAPAGQPSTPADAAPTADAAYGQEAEDDADDRQWNAAGGELELKTLTVGCVGGKASQLEDVAARLVADATQKGLGAWSVTTRLNASVWLKTGDVAGSASPEAYTIEIGDVVVVTGNSPAGVALGAQALLELLARDKVRRVLPRGTLVAAPAAVPAAPAVAPPTPAAGAPATAAPAPAAPAVDAAFVVPPYLQDLGADGVTVMWWSAAPSYGWVEYGESEALGKKADTVIDGARETSVRRHAVRVPKLAPGTRYWYRTGLRAVERYTADDVIFKPDAYSPVYSFVTPSPHDTQVRCIVFADTHNNATFAPLLALPGVKPYDFSIFNGDCFADIKNEGGALGLLRAYSELVDGASRPAIYVRGNHEFRNAYAALQRHLFTYPEGRPYFAFTRGPVRFVVLDCGEDKRDGHPSYGGLVDCSSFRADVAQCLEREIASTAFRQARWHVLVVHIPLYGEGRSDHARPLYLPVLDKAKFDLELNGHIHVSKLMKPGTDGNPHPVVCIGAFCSAVGVFEASAKGWSIKVLDTTGTVVVEERGGR